MKYLNVAFRLTLLIILTSFLSPVILCASVGETNSTQTSVLISSSANSGNLSLRWAIENIEDGGTITFSPNLTINLETELVVGSKSITIDGTGKNLKIKGNKCRIFKINGSLGKTYLIKGLTLNGGEAKLGADLGGGLYADLSSGGVLNVSNCIFSGNSALHGGGAYVLKGGTFTDCTFTGNSVSYYWGLDYSSGGGAYADGGSFVNCIFSDNYASNQQNYSLKANGAGAYAVNSTLTNCIFNGNSASTDGGGAWISEGSLSNCSFSSNTSGAGGGLFTNGNNEINYCAFNDNKALGNGGGANGPGNYKGCTFKGNTADKNGGGIYSTYGSLSINCVFINNYSSNGGGVFLRDDGKIINCTFYNNSARWSPSSGANVPYGFGKVSNSIFWNNDLYGWPEYCAFSGSNSRDGCVNITESPFVSETDLTLNNNSGGGSLCWDSGNDDVNNEEKDVAGNTRKNRRIDIGAFESTASCLNNLVVINNANDGYQSLRWAVENICDGGIITFQSDLFIRLDSEILLGKKSISIDTKGKDVTVSGRNSNRVFNIKGETSKIYNLTGLTVSEGSALEGGGLMADMTMGTLNVNNCTFSGNSSKSNGGGVSVSGGGSFVNCNFNNNTASWGGGGVYTYSGGSFINCSFGFNNAGWGGGGAYTFNGGAFKNCVFWNSSTTEIYSEGAGMSFDYCAFKGGYVGSTNIVLTESPFISNNNLMLNTEEGGGYLCWNTGNNDFNTTSSDRAGNARRNSVIDIGAYEATENYLTNITVTNGASDGYRSLRWAIANIYDGGIITFKPGLTITLDSELSLGTKSVTIDGTGKNITISGNNACRVFNIQGVSNKGYNLKGLKISNGYTYIGFGGGMFADILGGSSLYVTNCIFDNNFAMLGGGVHANFNGKFINCTFLNNSAYEVGAGVHVSGGVSFVNCVLWDKDMPEIFTEGIGYSFSHCAIKDTLFPGVSNVKLIEFPYVSETDLSLNEFVEGGVLCWAAGNNDDNSEERDIAGNNRKVGIIDIGAYELSTTCINNLEVFSNASQGIGTLRWAIDNICDGGAISFKSDMDIILDSELLFGSKSLTIDAAGKNISVSGNNSCRVMHIKGVSNKTYNLYELSIINGNASEGGGILSDEDVYSYANITDCTFSGNNAVSDGGAVKMKIWGTFTNCTFTGNNAGGNGGGARCKYVNFFNNCNFIENNAKSQGGGIYSESVIEVNNCLLQKNSAYQGGGAFYKIIGRADNTVFDQNTSFFGAGFGGVNSFITNCTFNRNMNYYNYNYSMDIYGEINSEDCKYTNCIFWHDGVTNGINSNAGTFSHCAVKDGIPGTGNVNLTESPFVDDELNLSLNTNPGGGLLCIDAGFNDEVYVMTDIRGEDRIQNSIVDIGAYEWKKGLGGRNPFPVNVWIGLQNNEWSLPANWNLGIVPDSIHNAIVETASNYPVISNYSECKNLIINDGWITINPGATLNVFSSIVSDSTSRLVIKSDKNGSGILINNTPEVHATVEQGYESSLKYLYTIPITVLKNYADIFADISINAFNESAAPDIIGFPDVWSDSSVDSLIAGIGYRAHSNSSSVDFSIVSFEGELASTDYKITTNYSGLNNGWNLIGNPYPCKIDWEIVNDSNVNVGDAIYTWNSQSNSYSSWIAGIGVPSAQTQVIEPMQAFFVRANSNGGSVTFLKEAKLADSKYADENNYHSVVLRFAVSDELGRKDESVVRIYPTATHSFDDKLDAYKFKSEGSSPMLYSVYNDDIYSVNSIPSINDTTVIPFELIVTENGNYTIELTESENYNFMYGIYLNDHSVGKSVNLIENNYIFNVNKAGTIKFDICFLDKTGSSGLNINTINVYRSGMNLRISGMESKGNTVLVSNISGQTIFKGKVNNSFCNIPVFNRGIYIVNVISGDGTIFNSKVSVD